MTQLTIQQAFDLARQRHQAGNLREAELIYRQILAQQPEHVDALRNLAMLAFQAGRNDIALDLIRRVVALKPNEAEAHYNLGNVLKELRQFDDAIAAYRQAIVLDPNFAGAHNNLGLALQARQQIDEAIAAFRRAVGLRPDAAVAHYNLGIALKDKGQFDEAIAAFRRAIALRPNDAEAYGNLGNTLTALGQLDEAIAAHRQALAINPNLAEVYNNLGNALKNKGQLHEALAAYQKAIALKPDYVDAHSNLIYGLSYLPGCDPQVIVDEHRRWNLRHAEPLRKFSLPHSNDRDPDRPLRIGYVSADFWNHASGYFLDPLLRKHDHRQFEIFCYAQMVCCDWVTRRLQSYADHWHDTRPWTDEQFARRIREDRIDILVDLKLHTADHRLLVFARKPAPVQVSWLGYPGSSGLDAIDYRLTDHYLENETENPPGRERPIFLPDCFWCYDPLNSQPTPGALPALSAGHITFGCLNNFCKINDGVLNLWSKILHQVQGSRLLVLSQHGDHRQRTLDRLSQDGIDRSRVEFISTAPRQQYLEAYHRIDIGLDTLPYNGHTTSFDSLWMGVPVVTLSGDTPVGRAGRSILSNLGMPELIASTPEQYVQIAIDLLKDLDRLASLRRGMRARMQASPLMDAERFARNVEAAYRRMWREFCEHK